MKILVSAKRVPDPEQKVRIKDGKLDQAGINFVVNPFDEYAVEAALRLTEKVDGGTERKGEVIVVGLGPSELSQQLRTCLAMGADRAIHVVCSEASLDSSQVAKVLEAIYKREQPNLVLMGKQAVDGDNNQVPQLLAGYLGLPQACFACELQLPQDRESIVVGREVDGGTETKRVPLPAVVSVDLRIILPHSVKNNETPADYAYPEGPRYASLKGIMQAKRKPLDEITIDSLDLALDPAVSVVSLEAPPQRAAGVMVESVDDLVQKLRDEAKVL